MRRGAGRDDGDDRAASGSCAGGWPLFGDGDVVHAGVLVGGKRARVDLAARRDTPAEVVAEKLLLGTPESAADDVWDASCSVAAVCVERQSESGGDPQDHEWAAHCF